MEMGKLTAKLRDAVPVCLLVEGKEIKRYKNIEIPDELKKLEYQDFKFDVPVVGAITFKITFATGVLPDPMPESRQPKSRKPIAEIPSEPSQATTAAISDAEAEIREESEPVDATAEVTQSDGPVSEEVTEALGGSHETNVMAEEPAIMEIAYHETGERRKELVKAISQFTGMTATFQNAPTFAYVIGDYTVAKGGTLTGKSNAALVEALAEQGFIAD